MTDGPARPGRRDAVRNRARLVAAAEVAFREGGTGVPLDQVADLAGVGRGTLYRHFPDRASLVAAVFGMRLDALEEHVTTLPVAARLDHLVAEIAGLQLDAPGLMTAVLASADRAALLADVTLRSRRLLDAALAMSREHGRVRADVEVDDVVLVFAMVEGVIAIERPDRVVDQVRRAVDLGLRALLVPQAWAPAPAPSLAIPAVEASGA